MSLKHIWQHTSSIPSRIRHDWWLMIDVSNIQYPIFWYNTPSIPSRLRHRPASANASWVTKRRSLEVPCFPFSIFHLTLSHIFIYLWSLIFPSICFIRSRLNSLKNNFLGSPRFHRRKMHGTCVVSHQNSISYIYEVDMNTNKECIAVPEETLGFYDH